MKPELVGSQIRIRILEPSLFKENSFVITDVGSPGRLQIVMAHRKSNNAFEKQAYRLNLGDFSDFNDVKWEIDRLPISSSKKQEAIKLARGWFK